MKIRLGLWQEVDLDEVRERLYEDDLLVPENRSDGDVIDYLYARMSEDIDRLVKFNQVNTNIRHEILA